MGSRTKGYWIVFVIVLAVVIASLVMMRTGADEHTRQLWKYVGWGAIVVLIIARFVFRKPAPPTPPMPRD